jgi:glutamate dehydrogenase (NAD(P)+)
MVLTPPPYPIDVNVSDPLLRALITLPETGARAFLAIDGKVGQLAGGGLRFSPNVTMEEVTLLARTMRFKWAAMGMPFGGAKIGVAADPTDPAKPRILEELGVVLRPLLSTTLFTGPDMGTTSDDLKPLFRAAGTNTVKMVSEALGMGLGRKAFKELGGTDFEDTITGWGVYSSTAEACSILGIQLDGARVVIQGFGTVGSSTARFLHEKGAEVVAIADAEGTVKGEEGLDIPALLDDRDPRGLVSRRVAGRRYEILEREAWLDVPADVVIPAAVADAITAADLDRLDARLVVEAANIPVREEVERMLHARGVFYVPDFIANAGLACGFGLVVTGAVKPDEKAVYREVANRIRTATREVVEGSRRTGKNPRDVAVEYAEGMRPPSRGRYA